MLSRVGNGMEIAYLMKYTVLILVLDFMCEKFYQPCTKSVNLFKGQTNIHTINKYTCTLLMYTYYMITLWG